MSHTFHWFLPVFRGLFLGVAAMLLHELGHIAASLALGVKVKNIGLSWKGLFMVREAGPPEKNFLVSLAGPMVNFVLIAMWPISHEFGLANLCFAFFNLIPLRGSDGERAWICWDQMKAAGMKLRGERRSVAVRLVSTARISTARRSPAVSHVPLSGD